MAYNPLVTGGGTEATAQRVTIANDSTGVLSVDDNGGSITIDYNGSAISTSNPIPIQPPASGYLSTLAYGSDDSGTTKRVIKTDSGGAVQVDVESGTITTVSTVTNLSQLGGANVPIGAGLEATAVRVTLPTDGTGKVSVVQGTATNLKAQAEMYQGGTAVSSTNPLSIESTAIQDTGNSTSTPLGSSGNFTGSAFDMNDYASWSVNIYSDKASSSNGMIVQWSDDATHWDFQDAQTYNAAVGNMITFGRKARYVRLNYTNTNSAQSTFRVTSYAQPVSIRQTRKFIGNALTDQDTAQVVVAALQGHTTAGGGGWVDVKVNPSGSVAVDGSGVTQPVSYATTGSGTATGALRVEIANNGTGKVGLNAGTNAIGKLAANSGVDIGDVDVTSAVITGGAVAHDGADSGNPIKIGARATNVEIAAVANNDRSDLVTTLTGKLITFPFTNPENIVSGVTSAMTGTTSTSVIAAPAAGLRNYITQITVGNSHATVGTFVNIQDGSGGTTIWTIPASAVYGGATINFDPPLRQPTTATALYCACVTTGSNTIVAANGFKAA